MIQRRIKKRHTDVQELTGAMGNYGSRNWHTYQKLTPATGSFEKLKRKPVGEQKKISSGGKILLGHQLIVTGARRKKVVVLEQERHLGILVGLPGNFGVNCRGAKGIVNTLRGGDPSSTETRLLPSRGDGGSVWEESGVSFPLLM